MADAILKTCRKCGFERPLFDFRPDKRGSDGLWTRCKHCEPYGNRVSNVCGTCGGPKPLAGICVACDRRRKAEYKKRHAEQVRAAERLRMEKKRDAIKPNRRRRGVRRERNKEAVIRAKRGWKLRNPGAVNASTAARWAAKQRAIPPWADRKAMEAMYVEAAARGVHVDHIVPLRSPVVCGLHCEANLQLLPPSENISKSNRWWPDMWQPAQEWVRFAA